MPRYALDGRLRKQLRDAIVDGFAPGELRIAVGDLGKNLAQFVSAGTYEEQVDELIGKAFTHGWLIELCDELKSKRIDQPMIRDAISMTRQRLQDIRDEHDADTGKLTETDDAANPRDTVEIKLGSAAADRKRRKFWAIGAIAISAISAIVVSVVLVSQPSPHISVQLIVPRGVGGPNIGPALADAMKEYGDNISVGWSRPRLDNAPLAVAPFDEDQSRVVPLVYESAFLAADAGNFGGFVVAQLGSRSERRLGVIVHEKTPQMVIRRLNAAIERGLLYSVE